MHQFSDKTENFEFWAQIFPKKYFGVGISKLYVWIRNQHLQYTMYANFQSKVITSDFQPKFGEFAQLRAIFWFKYCRGCCRELRGSWNQLHGGGWSWMKVGARFSHTHQGIYLITINDFWLATIIYTMLWSKTTAILSMSRFRVINNPGITLFSSSSRKVATRTWFSFKAKNAFFLFLFLFFLFFLRRTITINYNLQSVM